MNIYLPVSLNVTNSKILIVGGGNVAVQKLSTLLFVGIPASSISVVSKNFNKEILRVIQENAIVYYTREYGDDLLNGKSIVISCTNDEYSRKRIYNDAKTRGILINTVDDKQFSTFILPAIVKHNDLTIAINSFGKFPLFVTFVRHTIEAIVTKKLVKMYDYIAENYGKIKERFPDSIQRRRVFFNLFNNKDWENITVKTGGYVYFVGSGVGDAEMITVKGLNALRIADVILYDNLIPNGLLDFSRRDSLKIDVAKYGTCKEGKCSTMQGDINSAIVDYAAQGKIVVRLKGGDCGVFGQLAQEVDAIVQHNKTAEQNEIGFEIISGVTSASAACSLLGIPLTAKGLSSSITLLTYHSRNSFDDKFMESVAMRLPMETYVVYMCGKTIGDFAQRVTSFDFNLRNMKIAIVQNIGDNSERKTISTLDGVIGKDFGSPVVAIVGNVLNLLT